jgi:putative glycosyltransferase (TIGR04372 family)
MKFLKKLFSIFYQTIITCMFYIIIPILILIKYFTNYRFSFIDYSRIGNNLNILLFLRLNNSNVKVLDKLNFLFIPISSNIRNANYVFFNLIDKKIKILPNKIYFNYLGNFLLQYNLNLFFNFQSMSLPTGIKYHKNSIFYKLNEIEKKSISNYNKNLIDLNEEIEEIGNNYLESINSSKNKFICFHARDNAYLNNFNKSSQNYQSFRNTDIKSFEKGLNYLAEKNYKCIRMGAIVDNEITFKNKNIIDYAMSGKRSDKLDLFLSKYCSFFLGGSNGATVFAEFFNKPILYINCENLVQTWSNNSIFTMKKYFSEKLGRNLSYREILDNFEQELQKKSFIYYLKKQRIKIVDNSSEEIYEAVKEMELKIKNQFIANIEAKKLQDKFWKIAGKDLLKSDTFNISESFILSNKYLVN